MPGRSRCAAPPAGPATSGCGVLFMPSTSTRPPGISMRDAWRAAAATSARAGARRSRRVDQRGDRARGEQREPQRREDDQPTGGADAVPAREVAVEQQVGELAAEEPGAHREDQADDGGDAERDALAARATAPAPRRGPPDISTAMPGSIAISATNCSCARAAAWASPHSHDSAGAVRNPRSGGENQSQLDARCAAHTGGPRRPADTAAPSGAGDGERERAARVREQQLPSNTCDATMPCYVSKMGLDHRRPGSRLRWHGRCRRGRRRGSSRRGCRTPAPPAPSSTVGPPGARRPRPGTGSR